MHTSTRISAVAAAFILTLAACGDDTNDNAASTSPPAATAAPAAATTTVDASMAPGTIVDAAAGAGNFTTLVAVELPRFDGHGVSVVQPATAVA